MQSRITCTSPKLTYGSTRPFVICSPPCPAWVLGEGRTSAAVNAQDADGGSLHRVATSAPALRLVISGSLTTARQNKRHSKPPKCRTIARGRRQDRNGRTSY